MLYAALLAAGIVSAEPAFEPHWGLREFGLVAGGAVGTGCLGKAHCTSASPMVGLSVETGWEHARLWLGFESYPFYVIEYLPANSFEIAMQTFGLMGGGDVIRGGPWVTLGASSAGWGFRAVYTPSWPNRDRNHGVELRVSRMQGVHTQLTVGWHHSWVPRTWDDRAKPPTYPLDEP